MKFNLIIIIACLIFFISSCSSISKNEISEQKLKLNIQTNSINKERIIEILLKDKINFDVNFTNNNSYFLEDDLLNSNLNFFCNSLLQDEREIIEKTLFRDKKDFNKKILIIYSKKFDDLVLTLKEKYPYEEYFILDSNDYETQIQKILNVDKSSIKNKRLSKLDTKIQISHTPRVRNDILSIYFITDYNTGKTVVPIFKSYALNISYYSSSEIFHDATDFKKLVDFEGTFIPITKKVLENLNNSQQTTIKSEIEKTLVKDFLTIEKIRQNSLFRNRIKPDSGNLSIEKNSCVARDLNFWKVTS